MACSSHWAPTLDSQPASLLFFQVFPSARSDPQKGTKFAFRSARANKSQVHTNIYILSTAPRYQQLWLIYSPPVPGSWPARYVLFFSVGRLRMYCMDNVLHISQNKLDPNQTKPIQTTVADRIGD